MARELRMPARSGNGAAERERGRGDSVLDAWYGGYPRTTSQRTNGYRSTDNGDGGIRQW